MAVLVAALAFANDLLPVSRESLEHTASGPLGYAAIGLFAFLELGTFIGLVAPLEFGVVVGGALAGAGELNLATLLLVVWVCATLGDSVNFLVGRKLGRGVLLRHGSRIRVTRDRLAQIDGYFERHGPATVFFARFGMYVRTLVPFLAGSAGMRYRAFLPWSVLGCAAFAGAFTGLGFAFYRSLDTVTSAAGVIGLVLLLGTLGALIARAASRRRRGAATGRSP